MGQQQSLLGFSKDTPNSKTLQQNFTRFSGASSSWVSLLLLFTGDPHLSCHRTAMAKCHLCLPCSTFLKLGYPRVAFVKNSGKKTSTPSSAVVTFHSTMHHRNPWASLTTNLEGSSLRVTARKCDLQKPRSWRWHSLGLSGEAFKLMIILMSFNTTTTPDRKQIKTSRKKSFGVVFWRNLEIYHGLVPQCLG